jgi:hypothetical protein
MINLFDDKVKSVDPLPPIDKGPELGEEEKAERIKEKFAMFLMGRKKPVARLSR